jgi:hypothetical protein
MCKAAGCKRPVFFQSLLEACTRIKVKRLFFALAQDLNLPVLKTLDRSHINFGAESVYIRTQKGNSLILKHPERHPMHSRYLDIVRLLIDAAPSVFSQKCFALKGGTAINLFLAEMPRLIEALEVCLTKRELRS